MATNALSEEQSATLGRVLAGLLKECDAAAVALCDIGGNILAQEQVKADAEIENVAALAAGSFAATRELAEIIDEPGFRSIFHRGQKSGILIQALDDEHLVVVILGEESIEGLVRLCLRKVARQLKPVLAGERAVIDEAFEVKEKPEPAEEA